MFENKTVKLKSMTNFSSTQCLSVCLSFLKDTLKSKSLGSSHLVAVFAFN